MARRQTPRSPWSKGRGPTRARKAPCDTVSLGVSRSYREKHASRQRDLGAVGDEDVRNATAGPGVERLPLKRIREALRRDAFRCTADREQRDEVARRSF